MDASAWAAIVGPITTLLGGLGGYWLAGRNDDARDRRAADREAAARRAALADRLEEDRHAFQRDTLLRLQEEVQRLARATTKILLQDRKTIKEHGQLYQLPPGLSDEEFEIFTAIQLLRARVLDDDLRQAVNQFTDTCSHAGFTTPGKDLEEMLAQIRQKEARLASDYSALNELFGERLRRELDRRFLAENPSRDSALNQPAVTGIGAA